MTAALSSVAPQHQHHNVSTKGEEEVDDPLDATTTSTTISAQTYRFVLCAALNSCNLGYDIGVSTEAGRLLQADLGLTNHQREIFIGSINFWGIFGAILAHYFTDGQGRRYTFVVAAVGFIFGIGVMIASSSYGFLLVGRALVGLGVGIGLAIDPLYIAEISPSAYRGHLVTYSEIAINVGIVLGFASGLLLTPITTTTNGGPEKWRVMVACGAILPVVMILLVLCHAMPESPRWLLQKGRIEEAQQVLAQVHDCPADHVLVRDMVREIQTSLQREQVAEQQQRHGVVGLFSLRVRPSLRRVLLIGVGTAMAQQAVGIDAIQNYLLDVIDHSAPSSSAAAAASSETLTQSVILISLGMLKLVFIMVGGSLFDTMGRRPLFLASVTGMALALLLISLAFIDYSTTWSHRAIICGLALYLIFFSIGMGPGAWLIPSEIFPLSIRGKAMSLATLGNRVTATFMSSTFLSTSTALGWSGFFFLLFIVCLIVLAFVYFYLPETKGHSLEEMTLYFAELTGDTSVLEAEERVKNHYYVNNDHGDDTTAVVEMAPQQHKSMTTGGNSSASNAAPLATNGEII